MKKAVVSALVSGKTTTVRGARPGPGRSLRPGLALPTF